MGKTISIIIATMNACRNLRDNLESIIPQLTEKIELIIIDGGSTDGTNEIIASYGNKISYTISEPDQGIYDAWNKGVKIAKGEWIAFIGSDDILLPGAIEAYLDIIAKTKDIKNYDYICAHNEYVDMKGKILKLLGKEPKWSAMRRMMQPAHVASLHNKRNLFDVVGYYDYQNFHICADYELLMRKRNNLKYIMIPQHIARMKVGGMSFSTKAIKETYYIRKLHNSVSPFFNVVLFIRDWLAYNFFILRKSMGGGKLG